jgi:hypothetical protein
MDMYRRLHFIELSKNMSGTITVEENERHVVCLVHSCCKFCSFQDK